jgi:hypothetical protein
MAPIQDYLDSALRSVERLLGGESLEDLGSIAADDLARVERWMGLPRPLASYSPRSRRRFISAARRGYRPREIYARERAQRHTNTQAKWGLTPTQFRRVHALMLQITALGVDVEYYHDPPVIKEFATLYGYDYLVTVFTQQVESIQRYLAGSVEPGRTRWNERGSIEERYERDFGASMYFIRGTDPFYYYHGTRR